MNFSYLRAGICPVLIGCLISCQSDRITGIGETVVPSKDQIPNPLGEAELRTPEDSEGPPDPQGPPAPEDPQHEETPTSHSVNDRFTQNQNDAAYDFLWVFDNSASMSPVRQFVRSNLNAFLQTLQSRKAIDYQMALTTTDYFSQGGRLVSSDSGRQVVRSSEKDAIQQFGSIIENVAPSVPDTSFWEQGLESSLRALDDHGRLFLRANVPLIVTYLTNEDDYSCLGNCFGPEPENPVRDFPVILQPLGRYRSFFARLKGRADHVLIYPMTSISGESCQNPSLGLRYQALQMNHGTGKTQSICPNELAASFDSLARIIADRGACFNLSRVPVPNTLKVFVDEKIIPVSDRDGYAHVFAKNEVCFSGSHIPRNGSRILFQYEAR